MLSRILALVLIGLCAERAGPLSKSINAPESNQKTAVVRKFYPLSFQYRREIYKRINSNPWQATALVYVPPGAPSHALQPGRTLSPPAADSKLYQLKRLLL